jgi:hypothetical protein
MVEYWNNGILREKRRISLGIFKSFEYPAACGGELHNDS